MSEFIVFVLGVSVGAFLVGVIASLYQTRTYYSLNLRLKLLEKEGVEALDRLQKESLVSEHFQASSRTGGKKGPGWNN